MSTKIFSPLNSKCMDKVFLVSGNLSIQVDFMSNDEVLVITAADSGITGYRFYDPADISCHFCFHEVRLICLHASIKLAVCMTNFDVQQFVSSKMILDMSSNIYHEKFSIARLREIGIFLTCRLSDTVFLNFIPREY